MDHVAAQSPSEARTVRAPRGTKPVCRGWSQEAALRMLMNSLDPEIAERPQDLVVFGSARAALDWASFDAIVRSLRDLGDDETLLVQSGKPVSVFRTHEWAPRALIAGAASWVHVGIQSFLQCAYEIFAAAARRHWGGNLAGKLIVTGGMGRIGGVQPLAATMNGAAILCVEVDPERIKRWMKAGYCEVTVNSLDEALRILKNAVRKREPASVGLIGNCADILPELARRGIVPDLLTDQTSAHDPTSGYLPSGLALEQAAELRRCEPDEYHKWAMESIARQVEAMLALVKLGSVAFEWGNHIRHMAFEAGVKGAFDFPDFASAYLRPLLYEGKGPIRWVALSGDPADIRRIDQLALDLFGEDEAFSRWIHMAQRRVRFQGLPARVGWLGYGERERFATAINDLVTREELKAPIVIAREDVSAMASPRREVNGTLDDSHSMANWLPLNALLSAASGASWVSIQNGGETGIGYSQFVELAVVADGTKETGIRIQRVLANDSAIGMARLGDAGYPRTIDSARKIGLGIPTDESKNGAAE